MMQQVLTSLFLIFLLFIEYSFGETYIIGYPKTLSWDTSSINANKSDITLYYGNNLQSNWTVAENVNNTGSYTLDISLNGTTKQFSIPIIAQDNFF